jgi:electron transfer flavoprotein beta subunit
MNPLNIAVCIKQVPDPEAPISGYRIDSEARRVVPVGIPPVISPFDENALELALRLKDTYDAKVTALSAGHPLSPAVLRKALFAGADELILVETPPAEIDIFDSLNTASLLAEAIKKIRTIDLIFTGRQASDTNAGMVGIYLAELLHIPAVTFAKNVSLKEKNVHIERILPDGIEFVEAALPVLITVGSEAGELRNLDMKRMREAKSKPILKWSSSELPSAQKHQKKLILQSLKAPKLERKCLFVQSASAVEAGEELAARLKEDKVL